MDSESAAEAVLESNGEAIPIIPVHEAPMVTKLPKVRALYRPQMFVESKRFIKQRIERGRRKKLLVMAGSVLIIMALLFGLLRTLSQRMTANAAAKTADSFIQAEFAAETDKALKLADQKSITADNLKALALLVKPTLKDRPVRTGQDVRQYQGQQRGVFTYRFSIANPADKTAEAATVHLVLLLQKDHDTWRVKSQSMSAVAPKADVPSYKF